jgi:hypothetical protein
LRGETRELNEWFRLFALINLTLENEPEIIDLTQVELQQQQLEQPLRTPARSRGRLRFEGLQEQADTKGSEPPDSIPRLSDVALSSWDQIPETPTMNTEGFSTQEERDAWTSQQSLPANLVRTIHSLESGLEENANNVILMHRELNACWLLIVDDLRKLSGNQSVLQSQIEAQATAAKNAESETVGYQELHDKITRLLESLPDPELRFRALELSNTELEQKNAILETNNANLDSKMDMLMAQLMTSIGMVKSLQDSSSIPSAPSNLAGNNLINLSGDVNSTKTSLSTFKAQLEGVESQLSSLRAESSNKGTVKSFSGIIPNIRSVWDVKAWLTTAFRDSDGGGDPYHEDCAVGEYLAEDDIPTFGPYSDLYVILAVAEELEGTVTKGETLKERERIGKAGLNHPGESTVIYALKHTIPNFLAPGSANPRQSALKALKTAADFDQVFNKDLARGLKDVWEE